MHGQGREFYSCQARPQAKGRYMSMPGHGRVVLLMLGARSGQGYGIILQRVLVFYYSIFYKGGWGYLHAWPGKGVLFMLVATSGQGQGYEHAWPREGSFTYVIREVRPRVWDYSIEILVFYYSIFYKGGWGYSLAMHADIPNHLYRILKIKLKSLQNNPIPLA